MIQSRVSIYPAIPEKGPMLAGRGGFRQVEGSLQNLRAMSGCDLGDMSNRIRDEGGSPKIQVLFAPGAIDGQDKKAVGNGMASLDRLPSTSLGFADRLFLAPRPTDGGGVD